MQAEEREKEKHCLPATLEFEKNGARMNPIEIRVRPNKKMSAKIIRKFDLGKTPPNLRITLITMETKTRMRA